MRNVIYLTSHKGLDLIVIYFIVVKIAACCTKPVKICCSLGGSSWFLRWFFLRCAGIGGPSIWLRAACRYSTRTSLGFVGYVLGRNSMSLVLLAFVDSFFNPTRRRDGVHIIDAPEADHCLSFVLLLLFVFAHHDCVAHYSIHKTLTLQVDVNRNPLIISSRREWKVYVDSW